MMVAVACFLWSKKIDRQTVLTTLMVTTSYEWAVLAGQLFSCLKMPVDMWQRPTIAETSVDNMIHAIISL